MKPTKTSIELLVSITTPTMCASLRSDGLLQLDVNPGSHSSLPQVKEAIEAIGKAANGKCYPLLVVAGKDSTIDTESMAFVSKKDADPHSVAVAFLICSISQKLLGNFYLNFNKPLKPTRIFTNLEDAVLWLREFRK